MEDAESVEALLVAVGERLSAKVCDLPVIVVWQTDLSVPMASRR